MIRRHRPFAVALAALLLLTSVAGVAADDTTTVTVEVRESPINGTFTTYFNYASFAAIETSETLDQESVGYVGMIVEDRRGNDLAWEVQFSIGDFVGQNTTNVILASGMNDQAAFIYNNHSGFTTPDFYDPSLQTFDAVTGVWSATGNQTGLYLGEWSGSLTIPAGTQPDVYTSELTLEITSAP